MLRLIVMLTLLIFFALCTKNSYCYDVPQVNVTAYYDDYYFFYMDDDDFSELSIYVNHNKPINVTEDAVYKITQNVPSEEEGWLIAIKWISKFIAEKDVLNYIVVVEKDGLSYKSEPRKFEVQEILSPELRPIPKVILQW